MDVVGFGAILATDVVGGRGATEVVGFGAAVVSTGAAPLADIAPIVATRAE